MSGAIDTVLDDAGVSNGSVREFVQAWATITTRNGCRSSPPTPTMAATGKVTPVGTIPDPAELNLDGLDLPQDDLDRL